MNGVTLDDFDWFTTRINQRNSEESEVFGRLCCLNSSNQLSGAAGYRKHPYPQRSYTIVTSDNQVVDPMIAYGLHSWHSRSRFSVILESLPFVPVPELLDVVCLSWKSLWKGSLRWNVVNC